MKSANRWLVRVICVAPFVLLVGCGSNPSVHGSVSVGYGGYYDPYPHWGHRGNTTVIIKNPDRPDRTRPSPPSRPKPSGGMGRPRRR